MRSQLRPAVGIKAALEQGAENGRVNRPPIERVRRMIQNAQVAFRERRHVDGFEQAAVKPGNIIITVLAAFFLHRGKQVLNPVSGFKGIGMRGFEDRGKNFAVVRRAAVQQAFVLGKHAEDALGQKMRHLLRFNAAFAHGFRYFCKLSCGLAGNRRIGFERLEFVRVGKNPAQNLLVFEVANVLQQNGARFVRVATKRGMDFDAVTVADNQQGRIAKIAEIFAQLRQSRLQVTFWLFVFPSKMVALPDIGPALFAAVLDSAFFITIIIGAARLVEL